MVTTADGRATIAGESATIGSDADTEMVSELRVLPDAILVGSGTMAAERYSRPVRAPERVARREAAGLPGSPLVATISRSGRVPWDVPLFADPQARVIVFGPASPPAGIAAHVVVVADVTDPAAVLAHLRRSEDVRLVMGEGGPRMNGRLLAAGLVDELFLTLAPVLAGDDDAPAIVAGPPLAPPCRLRRLWLLGAQGDLFARFAVAGERG